MRCEKAKQRSRKSIVSPLFPDRIFVGLAPAMLGYVRLQGVSRPKIVEKRLIEFEPQPDAEPWRAAIAALAEVAATVKDDKALVTVVLSNHFVRYVLVPRSEELKSHAEALAFARYCFGKTHGERSKNWDVRLSDSQAGSARVSSAVDTELLQAVLACFAKARLVSVQPYLMSAFNQWRTVTGNKPVWVLLVEAQRACLAYLENGRWKAIHNIRGEFDCPDQWAELLDRERHLVAEAADAEVLVHAPHRANSESMQAGGWQFRSLSLLHMPQDFSPIEDARFTMALCAL